jgi:hypothetical protein
MSFKSLKAFIATLNSQNGPIPNFVLYEILTSIEPL